MQPCQNFDSGVYEHSIDVCDFIQKNILPYHKNSNFIVNPSKKIWSFGRSLVDFKRRSV